MEDYALHHVPHGFRKWSEWRIAGAAVGSPTFLALEAIGAIIAVNYGFANAMWAILVVGAIIFLTGIPIAYYAARHNLDMDLLTRGAGFGYLGSAIASLAHVVFTFAFFAIEASIMAMAMQMAVNWPLPVCYALSALVIVPLSMRGIGSAMRLQAWTQPLWLFLTILPFAWIAFNDPQPYRDFTGLAGLRAGESGFQPLLFAAAAAVVFALIAQIAGQADYLRFMPQSRPGRRRIWWIALLIGGPGWIVPGMLKMAAGAFLAFLVMASGMPPQQAGEPPQMYLAAFRNVFGAPGLAVAATLLLVLVSQINANIANARSGSRAWSSLFIRIAHNHPGRAPWLVFGVFVAALPVAFGIFEAIEKILRLYGLVAAGWIGALAADLAICKPLRLSPPGIEFRRGYLRDANAGVAAMLLAILVGGLAHCGIFGEYAQAFASFIALGSAFLLSPLLSMATRGRHDLARQPERGRGVPSGSGPICARCGNSFEIREMVSCSVFHTTLCSLCCSLEANCRDRCKADAGADLPLPGESLPGQFARLRGTTQLALALFLGTFAALALTAIYLRHGQAPVIPLFLEIFLVLALPALFCGGWTMLFGKRPPAAEKARRQSLALLQEVGFPRRQAQTSPVPLDQEEC